MGTPTFPIPSNTSNIADLLNQKDWSLSIVRRESAIFVLEGDQVQFTATTEQEVKDFLSGIFLVVYEGSPLSST
jgi:hypothetical protein